MMWPHIFTKKYCMHLHKLHVAVTGCTTSLTKIRKSFGMRSLGCELIVQKGLADGSTLETSWKSCSLLFFRPKNSPDGSRIETWTSKAISFKSILRVVRDNICGHFHPCTPHYLEATYSVVEVGWQNPNSLIWVIVVELSVLQVQ